MTHSIRLQIIKGGMIQSARIQVVIGNGHGGVGYGMAANVVCRLYLVPVCARL
jgi:ribosomal protein S5